ncbi:hypothetical protein GCM10020000_01340 [Streptomyces olivoverticillatus]
MSLPWFLWHRTQDEPGGDYGDWQRVSAVPIGPKISYVTAAESSDGRLEAFFPHYGVFCHTAQRTPDGDWSAPEDFGLNPSPYHGGVTFFREHDGSLDAFASSSRADSSMDVRSLRASSDTWGPVRSLGKVPDPNVGLSSPDTVTELPDGLARLGGRRVEPRPLLAHHPAHSPRGMGTLAVASCLTPERTAQKKTARAMAATASES